MDNQEYAVKMITFKENGLNDKQKRDIFKEVEYLSRVDPQFVAQYFDSWRESDIVYIQLEIDLKPDNILIADNILNGRFVKLCDFGLVTEHNSRIHNLTDNKHSINVGTTKYRAPEVAHGKKYDHTSDIWGLALIGGDIFSLDVFTDIEK
ncbi:unnamed protein product [Oppiella nova]|uniref:Protein kinase domain-containing protein n=1 Tax=Oppiella nova TaxID=334625 RepID=A0A7R9LN50_9ACAR|nr:unnamed protein product [Oppiella nova]CAG2165278.1 unnamed protein product [Oppiella nova]